MSIAALQRVMQVTGKLGEVKITTPGKIAPDEALITERFTGRGVSGIEERYWGGTVPLQTC